MAAEDIPLFPPAPAVTVERTLAIIKPDVIRHVDEIVEEIKSRGFTILQQRRLRLSPEQATDFYSEHYGKMFFPSLIAYMHSDDILALVLAKPGAVQAWRDVIGPTHSNKARQEAPDSLRARYGTDQTRNAVHGSDSYYTAEREIRFMFPGTVTEPIYGGQLARDYLEKRVNPVLVQGLTELCKQKPEDAVTWLAKWLLKNNPNKPLVEEPSVTEPIYGGQLAGDYLEKRVNPVLVQGLTELCKQKPEDAVTWLARWLLKNNPTKPLVEEPCT